MLPWSEENRTRFVEWFKSELELADQERGGLTERWNIWRRHRLAEPGSVSKNTPWKDASNVSTPVASINGQSAYGNMHASFAKLYNLVTAEAIRDNDGDVQDMRVLTKYLDMIAKSPTDMNLPMVLPELFYETVTMGYLPVKVAWDYEAYPFRTRNDDGVEEEILVTLHDGVSWFPIPLEDFHYRRGYRSMSQLPWFSHEVHLPWHSVKNKGDLGVYENVEDLEAFSRDRPNEEEQSAAELGGYEILNRNTYDIHEVNARWDVDDDGRFEDIVVTIHVESGTVLREDYNKIPVRNVEVSKYMFVPFSMEGRGSGQMSEYMQEEADTHHNMRVDAVHMALMQMFVARKNAGIRANEKIFPGKIFMVDDPQKDLTTLRVGEVYPSSMQAENLSFMYAQKNMGISDTMGGFADQTLKSRDTMGGQVLRAKYGEGIFSSVMQNMQNALSNLFMVTLYILIANKKRVLDNEKEIGRLSEKELGVLERILSMSVADVPKRLWFRVDVSDVEQSFEMQRQNTLTLFQIYSMFVKEIMPIMQIVYNPEAEKMMSPDMLDTMRRILVGFGKLMEDSLKFFGKQDTGEYLGTSFKKMDTMMDIRDIMNGRMIEQVEQAAEMLKERMNGNERDIGRGVGGFGGGEPAAVRGGNAPIAGPGGGTFTGFGQSLIGQTL